MNRISDIRRALAEILECIRDDDVYIEWRDRGEISVLWTPFEDGEQRATLVFDDENDDEPESAGDLNLIVELPPEYESDVTRPLLSADDGNAVRQRAKVHGIDALAWYMPFHQTRWQWGCYVTVSGMLSLADEFLPLNISADMRIVLSFRTLLAHELGHFTYEYMAAQWELARSKACYWKSRDEARDPILGYAVRHERAAKCKHASSHEGHRLVGSCPRRDAHSP